MVPPQVDANKAAVDANKAAAASRKAAKSQPVELDFEALMMDMLSQQSQEKFLNEVFEWLAPRLPANAAGLCCPVRNPEEVKKIIADSGNTKSVQSGGTLSMLQLSTSAFPRTCNSKVLFCLNSWDRVPSTLGRLVGTVQINSDLWGATDFSDLVRASADAEFPSQMSAARAMVAVMM